MAQKKFKVDLNLEQNQLKQALAELNSGSLSWTIEGQFYYDSSKGLIAFRNASLNKTVVTDDSQDTFTNKTIDANGTGNSISNLEVEDFLAAAKTSDLNASALATQFATADAIKTYVDNIIAASDALVFKGGLDASGTNELPTGDAWDVYKITVAGDFNGTTEELQVGDTVICTTDSTLASTPANWIFLQSNLEQATESVAGFAKIATQVITDAGTNDTDIVTPLKLATYLVNAGIKALTFENWLTELTGVVKLGGVLTQNTVLDWDGTYTFTIQDLAGLDLEIDSIGRIQIDATNGMLITDNRATKKGFEYADDYSTGFTNRSLIDKAYADAHIGSKPLDITVTNPWAGQDGFAIVWDNTSGTYKLVEQTGTVGKYTQDFVAGDFAWTGNNATLTILATTHWLWANKNIVVKVYEDWTPNDEVITWVSVSDTWDVVITAKAFAWHVVLLS